MPIGVGMMASGGLLAVLAAWRYHVLNVSIESGVVGPDRALVVIVTAMIILMCVTMILYMLLAAQHT